MKKLSADNKYTQMQKKFYQEGTTNHESLNDHKEYWDIILGGLKNSEDWSNKKALDFACGKGRNVKNMRSLCDWERVDGIDISEANISYCRDKYPESQWFVNNGIDLRPIEDNVYDFVMSTVALQHIPVYDIRKSLLEDIYRVLKPGGMFSFQMAYGKIGDGEASTLTTVIAACPDHFVSSVEEISRWDLPIHRTINGKVEVESLNEWLRRVQLCAGFECSVSVETLAVQRPMPELSNPYFFRIHPNCVSSYYDNYYTARATNSENDVRVENEEDVVQDLSRMGFVEISCEIFPCDEAVDSQHPSWIHVTCHKPAENKR